MNIVLYGATGTIGSRVLNELISRGHRVKAVVREPSKLTARPGLTTVLGDILRAEDVARQASGADVVISAYGPGTQGSAILLKAVPALIDGVKKTGVKRLLMVGSAGSFEVAPEVKLFDAPDFPAVRKDALDLLRGSDFDWRRFTAAY
jgi:putative NADH-flavin reductase